MSDIFIDFIKNRNNNIVNIEWWESNFVTEFLNSESTTKKQLNKKSMRLSNEFISARVLSHWQKRGLIADERPDGKGWRKFTPSEVMWIGIIIKLRKFGMDFDKIKKVKKYLEYFQGMDNLSKFPELDFYIINGMKTRKPVKLLVFESGETILARRQDIDYASTKFENIKEDYITIDISKMFNEGVKSYSNDVDYLDFGVTPIESEIRQTLSLDGIKSLTIKINNNDEYLIGKEFLKKSKTELDTILNRLQYGEATTIKRGGKTIHKIVESKKIKKE